MTPDTPIEFLKTVGTDRAKLLKNVFGLSVVGDLLDFFPYRYIDKTKFVKISQLADFVGDEVQIIGKIIQFEEVINGKVKRLSAKFSDGSAILDLVWFQYSKWFPAQLVIGKEITVFGKVQAFQDRFSMPHPEIEAANNSQNQTTLLPVYPSSEKITKRGISQKFFQNLMRFILAEIFLPENLPQNILAKYQLISRNESYRNIHFPADNQSLSQAERRLKFEESFFFQLKFALKKLRHHITSIGNPFPKVGDNFNDFFENQIPFELTDAQKKVLKEIRNDLKKPRQMNRLLQGDVGSGKTIVALLSMLLALDNGFQSCLMAPTEILAQQHFYGISELLKNSGINVRLLTGSTKKSERKIIHEELLNGSLSILIGTHAVLEDVVMFKNLGFAIIDEQHRFGVAQRAKLWAKNKIPPHILIMTATPIPRTLAMSFYSDLDVSVIDQLPAGRKPIITAHRREKDRLSVYNFAKDELWKGRQIYFVYPLIEESETLDYKNLMEGFEQISQFFSDFEVSILHGKMKPDEKELQMQNFVSAKTQIMVATTVIEVGVNVPNASVMVIESAERFGLSQLHQLRGRVGRGAEQSFCILMTDDKMSADSRKRIKTICETTDGFRISEVDMELRGPGDILGTQQSGVLDFKKLNLVTDSAIITETKNSVEDMLREDATLSLPKNSATKDFFLKNRRGSQKWDKIS